MNSHRIAVVLAITLPAVLLVGCQPEPAAPKPSPSSTESSPSASPSPTVPPLPPDAVLGMIGTVTADNGASLEVTVVVHSPAAADDAASAARVSAIAAWCLGELDADVMASQRYSLLQVDYTADLLSPTPWPADLPLLLLPTAEDAGLASSGAAQQLEVLAQAPSPGDYVPHCQQSAYFTGPGAGTTYVAFPGDAAGVDGKPALTRWADFRYGVSGEVPPGFVKSAPFGGADPGRLSFAGCAASVTALGSSLGAPSSTWAQVFSTDRCFVGGATP